MSVKAKKGRWSGAMVVALALSLSASSATADIIMFDLNTPNLTIAGFPPPYQQVTVDRTDATHATITFDALHSGPAAVTYLMGDGGTVAVNVNATTWTASIPTGTNSFAGFTPGPFSDGGAGIEDGFGSFNQTFNSFDGFTHSSTEISFIIINTSGTWASAGSVLTANTSGQLAASHTFVCADPCTTTEGAAATGFAGGNGGVGQPPVPEPASLALLGVGLAALGLRHRRVPN